jgi:hypothetical protein
MAGDLLMALDTRVKCVAALKPDGDNVAIGAVVRALIAFIGTNAPHRYPRFHFS